MTGTPRRSPARELGLLLVLLVGLASVGVVSALPEQGLDDPGLPRFHVVDARMGELVTAALAENPRVLAAWSRSRSRSERSAQVGVLPDPQINYRYYLETPETRVGPQEHVLELSQSVPWKGKLELQSRREETLAEGSAWQARDLERRLIAGLKRDYFEVAYLHEALAVNAEELELLRRFESIALRRYSTGQGIQQSVVKVQTDISRLLEHASELEAALDTMLVRIGAHIGRPGDGVAIDPPVLGLPDFEAGRDQLEQLALEANPRLRAVERSVEADRLLAERRSLDGRPDFRFGLGYTLVGSREDAAGVLNPPQDNGKDAVGLMVGVNIPIYRRRIHAGVAEARESELAGEQLLQATRDDLLLDIERARIRLESLAERGALFHDVIIPQAEESLASAEAAYSANRLGFLDLLDAQRVLFRSRLAYSRLVCDAWIALAELELALGHAFPTNDANTERASTQPTAEVSP